MTLFIGGPWNGQNRSVPRDYARWQMQMRQLPKFSIADTVSYNAAPLQITHHATYNKLTICDVEIFAVEGLSAHDVMRELLEHYTP